MCYTLVLLLSLQEEETKLCFYIFTSICWFLYRSHCCPYQSVWSVWIWLAKRDCLVSSCQYSYYLRCWTCWYKCGCSEYWPCCVLRVSVALPRYDDYETRFHDMFYRVYHLSSRPTIGIGGQHRTERLEFCAFKFSLTRTYMWATAMFYFFFTISDDCVITDQNYDHGQHIL